MKEATISQAENGMYEGTIKDEFGDVESATLVKTAFEVHRWAAEHDCDNLILTQSPRPEIAKAQADIKAGISKRFGSIPGVIISGI